MKRASIFLCALNAGIFLNAGIAAADDLGRLFFTPAQRVALDNARKMDVHTSVDDTNSDTALPQTIHINGLLRRSDGKTTIWINNREFDDDQANGVGVAARGDRVRVTVPDSGRIVNLKVGQSLNIVNGDVQEGYMLPASAPTPAMPASSATAPTSDKAGISDSE